MIMYINVISSTDWIDYVSVSLILLLCVYLHKAKRNNNASKKKRNTVKSTCTGCQYRSIIVWWIHYIYQSTGGEKHPSLCLPPFELYKSYSLVQNGWIYICLQNRKSVQFNRIFNLWPQFFPSPSRLLKLISII